jgi:hypothetical protein
MTKIVCEGNGVYQARTSMSRVCEEGGGEYQARTSVCWVCEGHGEYQARTSVCWVCEEGDSEYQARTSICLVCEGDSEYQVGTSLCWDCEDGEGEYQVRISLSWSIRSISFYSIPLRPILILFSHLVLYLGFHQNLSALHFSPMHITCPNKLTLLDVTILITNCKAPHYGVFSNLLAVRLLSLQTFSSSSYSQPVSACPSLNIWDHVSYPYKTISKILVMHLKFKLWAK